MLSSLAPMNILGELSLAEKGVSSAKVILTGFLVVFSMLVFLIIIIKIYSAVVNKAQSSRLKVKKSDTSPEETKPAASAPVAVQEASPVNGSDEIPEEVIAVISAAVATVYGGSERVRIKSVKKSGSGRSAWANAGVLENTRPF